MRAAIERAQRIWAGRRRLLAGLAGTSGQTLAEYGLIVTLVALGVTLAALIVFRTALSGTFNMVTACFDGSC